MALQFLEGSQQSRVEKGIEARRAVAVLVAGRRFLEGDRTVGAMLAGEMGLPG